MSKTKSAESVLAQEESRPRKPRVLLFDIETAPNLGYVWGKYDQNVIEYTSEWHMLSWSAKWLDGKHVTRCLADYEDYTAGSEEDFSLVSDLWELFNEADIIIGHNGDKFDIRKTNTRFLEHGLMPPEPYKTVDTLKIARKYFAFNSNKLDDLGRRLGLDRKVKHSGFSLWTGCMAGDEKSWFDMKKYNRMDVILLEKVYNKLLPWIMSHPHMGILSEQDEACRNCASTNLQKRGFAITLTGKAQRLQCQGCGAWLQGKHQKMTDIK